MEDFQDVWGKEQRVGLDFLRFQVAIAAREGSVFLEGFFS